MFHPFTRPEIAPYFTTDPSCGLGDADFLECAMLRDSKPVFFSPDMWRVSPDGKATTIRQYWEDDADWNKRANKEPGSWLSPNMMVRAIAELVRHARGMAERFASPTTISFRCEWRGLKGRQFYDPDSHWFPGYVAHGDQRVVSNTWPVGQLSSAWAEIVSDLASSVTRLFTTDFATTPQWILGRAPTWLR